jgi:DNA-binding Lrp family transcriptional regulator
MQGKDLSMSAAYVIAQLADAAKLMPAIEQLATCAAIERWDAVDSHVQLVLRVSSPSNGLFDSLRQQCGLERIAAYEIVGSEDRIQEAQPLAARAYLFIDTDPGRKAAIQSAIRALPETLSCAAVQGGCDLVAMIQGETIAALERTINGTIRPLDGVLRLKHSHAIDLSRF